MTLEERLAVNARIIELNRHRKAESLLARLAALEARIQALERETCDEYRRKRWL